MCMGKTPSILIIGIVIAGSIVSDEFKHAIDVLGVNKFEFLKLFSKLPYNEQRIVRTILSKQVKLEKTSEFEQSYYLKRAA